MAQGYAVFKIPEGKLLKVKLTYEAEDTIIEAVQLLGDFFVHPEDGIEAVEQALRGVRLEEAAISEAVTACVAERSIDLLGITAAGIAHTILMAAGMREAN
ncbi:MAG TPA: lipoate protein ligase C-terminal domain-containing protein [bacterium]|nr:lipoate protein ligase C-terminal domain-containing protein [bacterium]